MPKQTSYSSFLLRVWCGGTPAAPRWHLLLEDTRTGERRGFAAPAQVVTFLEQLAAGETPLASSTSPRDEDAPR